MQFFKLPSSNLLLVLGNNNRQGSGTLLVLYYFSKTQFPYLLCRVFRYPSSSSYQAHGVSWMLNFHHSFILPNIYTMQVCVFIPTHPSYKFHPPLQIWTCHQRFFSFHSFHSFFLFCFPPTQSKRRMCVYPSISPSFFSLKSLLSFEKIQWSRFCRRGQGNDMRLLIK